MGVPSVVLFAAASVLALLCVNYVMAGLAIVCAIGFVMCGGLWALA